MHATDCEPGTGITKHNGAETTFIMGTGTCSCPTPNTSEILVPLGVSSKIPDNLLPRAGVCHDIFVCGLFTRPRMTYVYCSSAQNMLFEQFSLTGSQLYTDGTEMITVMY